MIDLKEMQKRIYQYKVDKGFNYTDVNYEFCRAYGELSEAFQAYSSKNDDLGEELADVSIFILSIAEIMSIDLEKEIIKKMDKNEKRKYIQQPDGKWIKIEAEELVTID